jgi:hypothetical protein
MHFLFPLSLLRPCLQSVLDLTIFAAAAISKTGASTQGLAGIRNPILFHLRSSISPCVDQRRLFWRQTSHRQCLQSWQQVPQCEDDFWMPSRLLTPASPTTALSSAPGGSLQYRDVFGLNFGPCDRHRRCTCFLLSEINRSEGGTDNRHLQHYECMELHLRSSIHHKTLYIIKNEDDPASTN